jgi:hypothetical protein
VQEKIFGPKKEEVTRGGTGLIKELHNRHTSPNIIKKVEMIRVCRTHRRDLKCIQKYVRKT